MSELCVYLNGHITGLVQSNEGRRGYQKGKKNHLSNNLKLQIDLNQNFEIPRIRTLKSARSNSFNAFNEDFREKKSRVHTESVQNFKNDDNFKGSMSKSISELFFTAKNSSVENGAGDDKGQKVKAEGSKIAARTKSLTLDEKSSVCSRSDSFGSPINSQVLFGRSKVRKRDSKKNVSIDSPSPPPPQKFLIHFFFFFFFVILCLSIWQACFQNGSKHIGFSHTNGIRADFFFFYFFSSSAAS